MPQLTETVKKVQAGKESRPRRPGRSRRSSSAHVKALPAHGETQRTNQAAPAVPQVRSQRQGGRAPVAVDGESFIQRWLVSIRVPVGALAADHNAA